LRRRRDRPTRTPRAEGRQAGRTAYALVMFVVVSVLAGVLLAGLVIPIAGLAAVGSRRTADELDQMPIDLAIPAQATRTRVLLANGDTLALFYDENRIYRPLAKIAPVMRSALLAIEDHRFYEHGPIDLRGIARALLRNTVGEGQTEGGSTLTQQYVKMVRISACEAAGDAECTKGVQAATVERKIRELRYAVAVERQLSKDEILERYLNIAYFGQGAYGVEAAARYYFGSTAAELTLPQAALLAGLVQNPDARNPVSNPAAALDRRDVVLNQMTNYGMVTAAQAEKAKRTDFDPDGIRPTRNGCVGTRYPFLCDYVYRTLLETPSLGKTREERERLVKRGGLVVRTAIDPKAQDRAQEQVSEVVGPTDPVIATMNMVEPGTGRIVAMAQSRPVMGDDPDEGETYYNLSAEPAMGGNEGYQAGSTFKTITAAAALEQGTPISRRYDARAQMNWSDAKFSSCDGREEVGGEWQVGNSTGRNGVMDMREALAYSVNNYFVPLALDTGMCDVTRMAEKIGVRLGTPDRDLVDYYQHSPAFTLGTAEVSPLSMAVAYATFAARGIHCNPVVVESITTRSGKELEPIDADCRRVMPEEVADGVNDLARSVMTDGVGDRALTGTGHPQGGKTGTTNDSQAVWFVGYTPEIAAAAMIAVDKRRAPFVAGGANFRPGGLSGYPVPSTGYRLEGSGSGDAGRWIWRPTMAEYLDDQPRTDFVRPPADILGRVGGDRNR
jgi:membrane peptidoglycan carboxypeptidase